jgi:hypothetical protein
VAHSSQRFCGIKQFAEIEHAQYAAA